MIFKLEVLVIGQWNIVPCKSMEIIFTEFVFAYSLAECHKKVATIIFKFYQWRWNRCLLSSSSNPGLAHLTVKTFHNYGKADCTGSGQSKSRRENKNFGPDQMLYSQSDFRGKNWLFGLLFFKHKLNLILPMPLQKKSELFNFKGIKLALKNLGRFSSPTVSRAFWGVNINILTYTYKIKH